MGTAMTSSLKGGLCGIGTSYDQLPSSGAYSGQMPIPLSCSLGGMSVSEDFSDSRMRGSDIFILSLLDATVVLCL